MIDQRVGILTSMSLIDLPDTCEVADAVDAVEDLLEAGEEDEAKEFVSLEIDFEWVQQLVFA